MRIVGVTCPHCGTVNEIKTDAMYIDDGLRVCDIDAGGCDKYFAYHIQLRAIVKTAKVTFGDDAEDE